MNQQQNAFSLFPENTALPLSNLTFSALCSLLENTFISKQKIFHSNSIQKNLDQNEQDSENADYDWVNLSETEHKRLGEIFRTLNKYTENNLTKKEQELLNNLILKYS